MRGGASATRCLWRSGGVPLVDGLAKVRRFFNELTDAGALLPLRPPLGARYLLRNHEDGVADASRVIVGGFNVSDSYFGSVEDGAWRDLGLLVEGDSVSCPAAYFDDLFEWALKPEGSMRTLRRVLQKHSTTDGKLHWLFGGPTRRLSPWARAVRADMRGAKRLDIVAGYFAPGPVLLRRSANVARRGEVRLVTAAKSDNNATIAAARFTYWTLLKRGVRVYEYQPTKLHTKLFVIDGVVHIGSANFDMRSLFLNLEMSSGSRIRARRRDARICRWRDRPFDGDHDGGASCAADVAQPDPLGDRLFPDRDRRLPNHAAVEFRRGSGAALSG